MLLCKVREDCVDRGSITDIGERRTGGRIRAKKRIDMILRRVADMYRRCLFEKALGNSPADSAEFERRAQEVALLLRSAGVPVLIETDQ